jgi:hypothetical protein
MGRTAASVAATFAVREREAQPALHDPLSINGLAALRRTFV